MSAVMATGPAMGGAALVDGGFGSGITPPRTRLRLTRRGRVVLTTLAALPLVLWAAVVVLGAGTAAAGPAELAGASFEYLTVGSGDTLWEIAVGVDPDADPRVVIDEIIRLNGLDTSVVEPGQRLALPAAD